MITPKDVQRAAKRLERENIRFRTFLKGDADPDYLDEKFHELHRELFEGYNGPLVKTTKRKIIVNHSLLGHGIDFAAGGRA